MRNPVRRSLLAGGAPPVARAPAEPRGAVYETHSVAADRGPSTAAPPSLLQNEPPASAALLAAATLPASARKRWEADAAEFETSVPPRAERPTDSPPHARPLDVPAGVFVDDPSTANSTTVAQIVHSTVRPTSARKRWEVDALVNGQNDSASVRTSRMCGELDVRSAVLKRWTSHVFALPWDGSSLCAVSADGTTPSTLVRRDGVRSVRVVAGVAPTTHGELVFLKNEESGGGMLTLRAPVADLDRWSAALRAAAWPLADGAAAATDDLAALRLHVDSLSLDLDKWSGFIGAIEERVDGFVEESARKDRREAADVEARFRSDFAALRAEREAEQLLIIDAVNSEHYRAIASLRLEQRAEIAAAKVELRAEAKAQELALLAQANLLRDEEVEACRAKAKAQQLALLAQANLLRDEEIESCRANAKAQQLALLAQANLLRDEEIESYRTEHRAQCDALAKARETLRSQLAHEQRVALTRAASLHFGELAEHRSVHAAAVDEVRAAAAARIEGSDAEHAAALERAISLHAAALRRRDDELRRLTNEGEFSFIYRYILRESRSQFDLLPLTREAATEGRAALAAERRAADAGSAEGALARREAADALAASHVELAALRRDHAASLAAAGAREAALRDERDALFTLRGSREASATSAANVEARAAAEHAALRVLHAEELHGAAAEHAAQRAAHVRQMQQHRTSAESEHAALEAALAAVAADGDELRATALRDAARGVERLEAAEGALFISFCALFLLCAHKIYSFVCLFFFLLFALYVVESKRCTLTCCGRSARAQSRRLNRRAELWTRYSVSVACQRCAAGLSEPPRRSAPPRAPRLRSGRTGRGCGRSTARTARRCALLSHTRRTLPLRRERCT